MTGLSTVFATGAGHKLEKGALIQDLAALHVSVGHGSTPSVSTQIGTLRRLMLGAGNGEIGARFNDIAHVRRGLHSIRSLY